MADKGLIGYDDIFNFGDDSVIQKVIANIQLLDAEYKKLSDSLKSTMTEMNSAIKNSAKDLSQSTKDLNIASEDDRKKLAEAAEAAEKLKQAQIQLKKAQDELSAANLKHAQEISKLTAVVGDDEKAVTRLKSSIDSLRNANKTLSQAYKEGQISLDQYEESVTKNNASIRDAKNQISTLERGLNYASKEAKSATGSWYQLNAALEKSKVAWKSMTEAQKAGAEGQALKKQIDELDVAVKAAAYDMGEFSKNVGNYPDGFKSLREEIRANKQELAALALAGKQNTEQYQALMQRTGELADVMSDVAKEVGRVGDEMQTMAGIIDIAKGITSAFTLAQSASALFGDENERLQETFVKLQAAMAALQALEAIGNMLKQESQAMILLTNAQRKAEILLTNLQSAAESNNIVVRKAATAAQWLLNKAMQANPATILVTAILAVVGALYAFISSTDKASKSQIALNNAELDHLDVTEKLEKSYKEKDERLIRQKEQEIALAKARGDSAGEIAKKEQELLQLKTQSALKSKAYYAQEIQELDKNKSSLDDLTVKLASMKAMSAKDDDIKAVEGRIAVLQKKISLATDASKAFEDASAAEAQAMASNNLRMVEISRKSAVAMAEARVLQAEKGSKQELELTIAAIIARRNYELRSTELSAGERKKITIAAEKEISDLRKEFDKKQREEQLEAARVLTEAKLVLARKGSAEEWSLKEKLIDDEYNAEVNSIRSTEMTEELRQAKLTEAYNKQLQAKIDLEKSKDDAELHKSKAAKDDSIAAEVLAVKESTLKINASYEERMAARAKMHDLTFQQIDSELSYNQALYDKQLISEEDYLSQRNDLVRQKEQERLDIIAENLEEERKKREAATQTTENLIGGILQAYSDASSNRIEMLQNEKEYELSLAGDNAKQKQAIEKKYNAQLRAEKRKQANTDKLLSVFNIGINTAEAASKALTAGPILGPILMLLMIALGVAQAAIVLSKPVPSFFKGVRGAAGGLAYTGEFGAEAIQEGSRIRMSKDRRSLTHLEPGANVFPADSKETSYFKSIMKGREYIYVDDAHDAYDRSSARLSTEKRRYERAKMSDAVRGITEEGVERAMRSALRDITVQEHNWDDSGYHRYTRSRSRRIEVLNQRQSMGGNG